MLSFVEIKGRISQIIQTGTNAKTTTFTYDDMGNIKTYSDGTTSATYTYDDLYRKITETTSYGTFQLTTNYTYNANGTKKTFTYPNNKTIEYSYDQTNQLTGINIPDTGYIAYGQYQWTRPVSITLPGGSTRQYAYDELMRTTAIQTKDPGQNNQLNYSYTYDKMDNIKTKNTEQSNYSYNYDELYRLNEVKKDTATTESYTYDQVGNRTASIAANNWSYNNNNELQSYNGTTYQYDNNGNTVQRTINGQTQNFVYDVENRLIQVKDQNNNIIATYIYDPFGRRIKKTVSPSGGGQGEVVTYYLYSDEGLIGEYDQTGAEIKTYGYKPNSTWSTDPVFMKQGTDYYFYQNDHLGTPQKITNISGAVVWSATYDAFGKATIDSSSTINNNLRFPGQYFDSETNLHYNWNRFYDPETGRYIARDPVGFDGGINVFAYASNQPMNVMDYNGLLPKEVENYMKGKDVYYRDKEDGLGTWKEPIPPIYDSHFIYPTVPPKKVDDPLFDYPPECPPGYHLSGGTCVYGKPPKIELADEESCGKCIAKCTGYTAGEMVAEEILMHALKKAAKKFACSAVSGPVSTTLHVVSAALFVHCVVECEACTKK